MGRCQVSVSEPVASSTTQGRMANWQRLETTTRDSAREALFLFEAMQSFFKHQKSTTTGGTFFSETRRQRDVSQPSAVSLLFGRAAFGRS